MDSLWVKWVHSVYIKEQDFWDLVPKMRDSWGWKMLCKVRDDLKQGFTDNRWMNSKIKLLPVISSFRDLVISSLGLAGYGVCDSDLCLLCGEEPETKDHLFYTCPYNLKCIKEICAWLDVCLDGLGWN
ncbi:uncharacterized protein LOC110729932 [Chenopodium quinoa]|uniref:uncharacterized protein LOC110729932 n=1 Tax=Chenopodium quinoa TaxID=63459 RepID=UPI000B77D7B9|nr:uncharacterized protein LOC110729932 [Chenopodium quinoa]